MRGTGTLLAAPGTCPPSAGEINSAFPTLLSLPSLLTANPADASRRLSVGPHCSAGGVSPCPPLCVQTRRRAGVGALWLTGEGRRACTPCRPRAAGPPAARPGSSAPEGWGRAQRSGLPGVPRAVPTDPVLEELSFRFRAGIWVAEVAAQLCQWPPWPPPPRAAGSLLQALLRTVQRLQGKARAALSSGGRPVTVAATPSGFVCLEDGPGRRPQQTRLRAEPDGPVPRPPPPQGAGQLGNTCWEEWPTRSLLPSNQASSAKSRLLPDLSFVPLPGSPLHNAFLSSKFLSSQQDRPEQDLSAHTEQGAASLTSAHWL